MGAAHGRRHRTDHRWVRGHEGPANVYAACGTRLGDDDGRDRIRAALPPRRPVRAGLRALGFPLTVGCRRYGRHRGPPKEAVRLITEKGNRPFAFTEEYQAQLDLARLRHTAAQMAHQMRVMDIDEPQVARRSGLSLDQLRGLLEHDLSRVSALEADQAFVRLVGTAYGWVRPAPDEDEEIVPWGSGNVWEDLGRPDPEDDDQEPKP